MIYTKNQKLSSMLPADQEESCFTKSHLFVPGSSDTSQHWKIKSTICIESDSCFQTYSTKKKKEKRSQTPPFLHYNRALDRLLSNVMLLAKMALLRLHRSRFYQRK